MKVLIIGCNGFIGKNLFSYLLRKGIDVYGTTHQKVVENKRIFYLDINNITLAKNFTHIIYLVHFNDISIINYYKKLLNYFGYIQYQYYISSYSAHNKAISNYGKLKYQLEQMFLNKKYYVISPGLVIGKGGIFYEIVKIVNKMPIIFYPKVKNSLMPILSIYALNQVIYEMLKKPYKSKVVVYSQKIAFEKILYEISIMINKKRIFIPIDAFKLLKLLSILDKLKFPISSDSLKGFIANQNIDIQSDMEFFNIKESLKDYLCNL